MRMLSRIPGLLFGALCCLFLIGRASARQAQTGFQYSYDDAGRLTKAVDSSGNVVSYSYDAVGNLLSTTRSTISPPSALAIFNFTPERGPVGTTVTIQGQSFSTTAASDTVQFNGTAATVTAATTTTLTVTVPPGAATGPISVTVGTATATTATNFTVLQVPTITSINPNFAFAGSTVSNFQVTGFNLSGATFLFAPSFVPPSVAVSNVSTNANGTSATMSLTPAVTGSFPLVATNSSGSSDQLPGPNNLFTVRTNNPSIDTDGDGLTDVYEEAIGSDPLKASTTGDGIPDGWALFFGLNPLDATGGSQTAPDGLTYLQAFQGGLNPSIPTLVPPAVSSVFPVDGATNYATNGVIVVRFNEALQVPVALPDVQNAINAGLPAGSTFSPANAAIAAQVLQPFLLRTCCAGTVAIPNTIQVLQGNLPIRGNGGLSQDGLSLVFAPFQRLSSSTTYTVRVQGVKAASGVQMTGTFQSSFTTGVATTLTTTGGILRTSPSNGATDVPTNAAFTVEFGGQVDPSTVTPQTFFLTDATTLQTIPGTLQVDPLGFTASFVPQQPYGVGRTINVALTSGIQSLAQNPFQAQGFSFTTVFASESQGPSLVAVSPANGATGIPLNSVLELEFNEPLGIISAVNGLRLQAGVADVPGAVALSDGDKRVTFTPQSALAANTVYSIVTTAQLTDVSGNPMVNPGTTTFTTGAAADTTTLTVTQVSPANFATGVPTNAVIRVQFSKAIVPFTATSTDFLVQPSIPGATTGPPIPGTVAVSADALSATFTPSSPLRPSTEYFFSLFGITDLAGQALNNGLIGVTGFTSNFTTATGPQVAPAVTAVSPPNGATGVPVNAHVVIQFGVQLDPISVGNSAITLSAGGTPVAGTISVSTDATTLTFAPTNLLAISTNYSVAVSGFTDTAGNTVTPFSSSFTTSSSGVAVTTGPSLVTESPINGATGVAVNTNIVLTFNEPINPITVNNNTFIVQLSITGFRGVIAGAYSLDATGTVVTFAPTSPFPANTTVFVAVNGLLDFAGNSNSSLSSSFTTGAGTDSTAPTVLSVAPANGATNVGLNSAVVLTFSKSLLNGSINNNTIALFANGATIGQSTAISADNRTVTLHAGTLPSGSIVTVVATSGVQDLSGNHLADFSSQFTTASVDTTNPSVVSQRPGTGASSVPLNANIALFLSEPMNVSTLNNALHVSQNGVLTNGTTQISDSGQLIQFTPSAPWANNALIQVFLDSTAQDVDGRSFFGSYEGQFTTVEDLSTTPPTVTGTSVDNATGTIPTNAPILIGFNETLNPATVNTSTVQLQNQLVFPPVTVPSAVSLIGGGTVIQLTPSAALAANAFYNVVISTGLQGTNGLAFAGTTLGITTGAGPDTTAPVVISVAPPDSSLNIGDNSIIRVRFSKAIDPLSVTAATIQVTGASNTAIPTSISFSNNNQDVLLLPQAALPDSTLITIAISGVQDVAGNAVVPTTTRFTTGAGPDTMPPTVISENPFSGATNVPLNAPISFQTNEPLDPGSVNSNTWAINDFTAFGQVTGTYSVSSNGLTASFVPSAPLAAGHQYGGSSNGITDLEGNLLSGPFLSFTMGAAANTVGPTVVGVSPPNALTGVPINARVLIQFDEPVDSLTLGQVTLSKAGVAVTVIPTLSNANQTLTLVPVVPLSGGTTYTVNVTGVQDLSGNALAAPSTTTFTTGTGADLTPPTVTTTSPVSGATGVPVNTAIQVQFSKRIDPLTVTSSTFFVNQQSTVPPVAGTITVTPDGLTATFTPSAPLLASTAYIVSVSGVTDLVGQQATGFINFTTGP